jgi:hypothetical protein
MTIWLGLPSRSERLIVLLWVLSAGLDDNGLLLPIKEFVHDLLPKPPKLPHLSPGL